MDWLLESCRFASCCPQIWQTNITSDKIPCRKWCCLSQWLAGYPKQWTECVSFFKGTTIVCCIGVDFIELPTWVKSLYFIVCWALQHACVADIALHKCVDVRATSRYKCKQTHQKCVLWITSFTWQELSLFGLGLGTRGSPVQVLIGPSTYGLIAGELSIHLLGTAELYLSRHQTPKCSGGHGSLLPLTPLQ